MSAQMSCGRGWKEFNQSCYKIAMDYHNIEECRRECKESGGHLASLHSVEENNLIISLLKDRPEREGKKSTWIAGSITERDGHFRWMYGTDWDFENWDQGEPDKKKFGKTHHECVFLGDNSADLGLWWDGVCKWSYWSYDCVCMKKMR